MCGFPDGRSIFYGRLREELSAFAEREFALAKADENGVSYRSRIEKVLKRAIRDPEARAAYEEELRVPPFPEALRYLWNAFRRLSARRGGNGFGLSPLGWSEIAAFMRVTGTLLAPWEIEIVELLDGIYLRAMGDRETREESDG